MKQPFSEGIPTLFHQLHSPLIEIIFRKGCFTNIFENSPRTDIFLAGQLLEIILGHEEFFPDPRKIRFDAKEQIAAEKLHRFIFHLNKFQQLRFTQVFRTILDSGFIEGENIHRMQDTCQAHLGYRDQILFKPLLISVQLPDPSAIVCQNGRKAPQDDWQRQSSNQIWPFWHPVVLQLSVRARYPFWLGPDFHRRWPRPF